MVEWFMGVSVKREVPHTCTHTHKDTDRHTGTHTYTYTHTVNSITSVNKSTTSRSLQTEAKSN